MGKEIKNEVTARLFALVDAKYANKQKDFAAAIGVNPSVVSQWRMEITESYRKRLERIAAVLGTTTGYILTGEQSEDEQAAAPEGSSLSNEFAILFEQLPPEGKNEIISEMLKRLRQGQ